MNLLSTPRLQLEPLEARHAEHLFAGLQDDALYSWMDGEPPVSLAWLRRRYERLAQRLSPDGTEIWLNWAVRLRADQAYAGYVQATVKGREALVAYVLFVDFWGRGIAREAVAAMIEDLRSTYDVNELTASVDGHNLRSVKLLASLGFRGGGAAGHDLQFHRHLAGPVAETH